MSKKKKTDDHVQKKKKLMVMSKIKKTDGHVQKKKKLMVMSKKCLIFAGLLRRESRDVLRSILDAQNIMSLKNTNFNSFEKFNLSYKLLSGVNKRILFQHCSCHQKYYWYYLYSCILEFL